MKENAYVELMKLLKNKEKSKLKIGIVISPLPDIQIRIGELQLNHNNLWISSELLESGLTINDKVALQEFDIGQMYLLLMKVVKL